MRFRNIKVGQMVYVPGVHGQRRRRWLRGRVIGKLAGGKLGPSVVGVQMSGERKLEAAWFGPVVLRPFEEGYPKGGKG